MQHREYPFNRVSRCVVEEVPGRGYRELPQSSVYGLCSLLNTNFYEKALFVKTDVAAALCGMNANGLCPSRYASIRCE